MATTPTSSPVAESEEATADGPGEEATDDASTLDAPPGPDEEWTELAPRPGRVNSPAAVASNRAERQREAEEDRGLVERAQVGDRSAFRKLVERHQRRAFAIALGLVRDENDAREIVQEAFLRVYRNLDKFQGGSSFFTWLYRIVTNLAIDLMRRPAKREVELFDNPSVADEVEATPFVARIDGADPLDVVGRRQLAARIGKALDALPPYHRAVILMRELEGMSYQEMAEAMQVSKGTIMSRLFHARQKLQRALADCYEENVGSRGAALSDDDGASPRPEEDEES